MDIAEKIDVIIKDKVEELITSEDRRDRHNHDVLKINIENTLEDLEDDANFFIGLLCSMKKKFLPSKVAEEVIPSSKILS